MCLCHCMMLFPFHLMPFHDTSGRFSIRRALCSWNLGITSRRRQSDWLAGAVAIALVCCQGVGSLARSLALSFSLSLSLSHSLPPLLFPPLVLVPLLVKTASNESLIVFTRAWRAAHTPVPTKGLEMGLKDNLFSVLFLFTP